MTPIIDCHVHICPGEVRQNREKFLEGEPEFSAIYSDPRAVLIGASELIESMDAEQVAQSVVFGFPWRKKENFRLNNDYVLDAARRFSGRLIPFCCLDPTHPQALKEVKRCLAGGARGVGELAFYEQGLGPAALSALSPLAACLAEADLPVLLHTNEPVGHAYPGKSPMSLNQIYNLIKAHPTVKWILAHGGGGLPFFGYLKKEVRDVLANCWFDTAAFPFLYRPEALACLAGGVGPDKLLFGTDFPLLPPSRYYRDFARSGLSRQELQGLYGNNISKILTSP
ncbi:MAG: amidohydrolase [Desulfohalobiaceae bacterium]|nr:amidohydrolase [Desulfohalobiaceae bacterium]